jgi:predicted nucleotidyltransferase
MCDQQKGLKDFFFKREEITLAFLFGSQAKGSTHPKSDFDIAVWFKNDPSIEQVNQLWDDIVKLLHKEVDLVVLNSARPTVAWAALRGNKILIRDFALYLRLFLNISREAEDMQNFTFEFWNWKKRLAKA